ncbi:MAG: hypothetical protein KC425_10680, partial [Anaerolineales bacterium]|nr:hypothetical protein [Anaerolineales bacterium]
LMREAMDADQEARLVEQEAAARATAQAQEIERRQLENDMRRFWNSALPWITAVVMIALAGLAGGTLYIRFMDARRPPVYSMPVTLDEIPMIKGPNGWQALSRPTLPANAPAEDATFTDVAPANWSAFTRHVHQSQLPLGASIDGQRQALYVDRNEHPHILIAGKSGSGKTQSGMIPYVLGMWASGAHVVIVNGAGSDFQTLRDVPNISFFPRADERELIRPLSDFLDDTVGELQRRDRVLAHYRAKTWRDLPPESGEVGEILIAVDEFLAIILAAEETKRAIAASTGYDSSSERRTAIAEVDHMVYRMWAAANKLASKSRKHGIHLLFTLTDPTAKLLGKEGMALRRQSLAVAFRMGTSAGSRAFLDTSHGDWAQGSVGLPTGQFLVNVDGQIRHCVSFHPSTQDIVDFIRVRSQRVAYNDLPDNLQLSEAVGGNIAPRTSLPPARATTDTMSQVETDASFLQGKLRGLRNITAVGRLLGTERGELNAHSPSGKMIADARAALAWMAEHGDPEAKMLLDIVNSE